MSEIIPGLIGIVGVIVGIVLQWFLVWLREARDNKRRARYLAIRMVCDLDQFLDICANIVGDDGFCCGQRNAEGYLEPQVSLPKGLPLPEDVDWRSIDHGLMYKILSLPNRIEHYNKAIAFVAEHSFPPDYNEAFEERQYRYACLGLDVANLTQELRSRYGIPKQEVTEWNPVQYLKNEKYKIDKRREDRKRKKDSH